MANNLLSINDLSKKEILELIEFANNFFNDEGSFRRESLFPDKTIANVFCEPSTRTRSSFAIAAKNLGFEQQFSRNHMQISRGNNTFSEVAIQTNTHATDWSWGVLLQDFDSDGRDDIFISNGIKR